MAAHDAQDNGVSTFVLGLDLPKKGVSHSWVSNEFGVVLGDVHVGFGEGHLQVVEESPQEGPLAVHLLQECETLRLLLDVFLKSATNTIPARQYIAALHPGKDPGNST